MLQKQDFIGITSKTAIVRLLEMMGFVYKRTRGHHIYEHCQTKGKVTIPNKVTIEAIGTRISIFNQAFFGSCMQEGKGD